MYVTALFLTALLEYINIEIGCHVTSINAIDSVLCHSLYQMQPKYSRGVPAPSPHPCVYVPCEVTSQSGNVYHILPFCLSDHDQSR